MTDASKTPSALDGVFVLDLSRILAGPTAGQLLGDLGATVIKIENPKTNGDDTRGWGPNYAKGADGQPTDLSAYFMSANRNKQSVAVDISTEEGQDIVRQLVARADIVIENYKPGGLVKYGLDHATLLKAHPGLVYCSISGFGQTGPNRDQPGYDLMAQGYGGIMSLTGDPDMRVSGKADQVLVRGNPKHVVGYLKEFLFDEGRARAPVRSLSGGEKARLLLAKLMAKSSNLLVLDEPTNDLDVETLDLLQELLSTYDGTVILVSHDRDFLDRVAATTIAMEGDGKATVYAGGWSDYLAQRGQDDFAESVTKVKASAPKAEAKGPVKSGLSFTEKHRLEALPAEMERLEAEIGKLEGLLSDAELFTREPVKFNKATRALVERQEKLAAAEEEWLVLEEKNGG